jgi:hypothetical protein
MVNSIRNKFVAGSHVEGFKEGKVCCWKSNEFNELFSGKSCETFRIHRAFEDF